MKVGKYAEMWIVVFDSSIMLLYNLSGIFSKNAQPSSILVSLLPFQKVAQPNEQKWTFLSERAKRLTNIKALNITKQQSVVMNLYKNLTQN